MPPTVAFSDFERDSHVLRYKKFDNRRIRLGMVGGGQGAFIGAVHRIAARLDDRYELVAGALSSDATRAAASATLLGIAPGAPMPRLRRWRRLRPVVKTGSRRSPS